MEVVIDCNFSSKHEKVSMSGFFKERSENVNDLALKSSPQKKHKPMPLINDSVSTCRSEGITSQNIPQNLYQIHSKLILVQDKENSLRASEIPATADQSILSISKIADAVSKMNVNDTPSRVLEALMKKVPLKPPRTSLYQNENTTLKNKTDTPVNSQISEYYDSPDTLTQSLANKDKSKGDDVLRDTTNIPEKRNSSVIEISSGSDGDWVDAKPNVEVNGTISSITESPSYSCSELEFSEDDTSNGRRQTDIVSGKHNLT